MKRLIVACVMLGTFEVGLAQEDPEYILTHKETKEKKEKPPCDCCDRCEVKKDKDGTTKCTKPKKEEEKKNWEFALRFGSVFQLNSTRSVIGQRDGTTRTLGWDIHAEANYRKSDHEVLNRADINVVFVKTPNTSGWVSATDIVDIESTYQYRISSWYGPFARAGMLTSLFVGRDLRTNSVQYRLPDGTLTDERTEYRLTDPFRPITFMQTVGMFVNPLRKEYFDLDFRGGLGMREVIANGQLGVVDDADTKDIVELVALENYWQMGAELIVMARGQFYDKRINYHVGAEFLLPVIRTKEPGDNRSAIEVLNKRFRLGFSYRLTSWATLLYEIRLVHQPQLSEQYQIQNAVGFKASYSVL